MATASPVYEAARKRYPTPDHLPRYGSLSRIIDRISPGEDVLDVGCSEGYLAAYLKKNRVWGVDFNPSAIEIAKTHCVDAAVLDLNKLPLANPFDRGFDTIVFADVLEHVISPEHVLPQIAEWLKPKGRLIISLPNVALWRVRLNLLFGKFTYTDYGVLDKTHLHLYTFATARALAEGAGVRIVETVGAANALGPVVNALPFTGPLFAINIILVGYAGS